MLEDVGDFTKQTVMASFLISLSSQVSPSYADSGLAPEIGLDHQETFTSFTKKYYFNRRLRSSLEVLNKLYLSK